MCYIPFFRTPSLPVKYKHQISFFWDFSRYNLKTRKPANFSTFWDFRTRFSLLNSVDFSNLVWETNFFCLKNLRKLNQKTFESIFYWTIVKNGISKIVPQIDHRKKITILWGFLSSIKWEKRFRKCLKVFEKLIKKCNFLCKNFLEWGGIGSIPTSVLLVYMF